MWKPILSLTLFIWICSCTPKGTHGQEEVLPGKQPIILGEKLSFHSDILQENRILNVYLPSEYHPDSAQHYPVIYLLDGSEDEDFIHVAGLIQYGTFPWVNMLPPSILVGIGNVDRRKDFTYPTSIVQDQKDFPTAGKSVAFIRFLEEELQPYIENQYPTSSEKMLVGQSLAGLLTTEVLLKKPDLFTQYVIISPSLWWDNESLLAVDSPGLKRETRENISVFVGVGKEGEIMEGDTRALVKKLKSFSRTEKNTHFQYFPNLDHATIYHLALYSAFQKLGQKPVQE
ncbi:MAG: alpha/beta hydrolase-fold protein [Bacteroidota bacterium]